MNLFNKPQTSSCVSCSVESCIHHSIANKCTAKHIDVKGKHAQNERDTICGTYCRKNGTL
ncbi:MAG: DUF1540 domain-containing protein [Clostridia bacterium]|nr:DUF1540 domain-containing protein [Clostridia bacterium]